MIKIEELEKEIKNILKKSMKRVTSIGILIIIILIIISAITYLIFQDEGIWKKDEKGRPSIYTNNVKMTGADGIQADKSEMVKQALKDLGYSDEEIEAFSDEEKIQNLGISNKLGRKINSLDDCTQAEILWCLSDEYSKYLSSPEELEYLLEAELVTQYPKIQGLTETKDNVNGIIEFKRIQTESETEQETEILMTYIEESRFEELLNSYNESGITTVFNHFTIDSEGNLIIAKWTETTVEFISDNPDKDNWTETTYKVTKENINYKAYVQQYTLSFEYLWSLLVVGESYDFVEGLARLAYESEIIIGVYDNISTLVDVNSTAYTVVEEHSETNEDGTTTEWTETYNYTDTTTTTTKINSVTIGIKYADVWIIELTSTYKNNPAKSENDLGTSYDSDSEEYNTTKQYTIENKYEKVKTEIIPKVDIKTDTDNNFVKLLRNDKIAYPILSKDTYLDMLVDILSENNNTTNMIELTIYLVNKAKNPDDESLTFDFSSFNTNGFSGMSSWILGDSATEYLKLWENSTLNKYIKGEISYSSYLSNYITEDKTKYICYTDSEHKYPTRNYGFGVCHFGGSQSDFWEASRTWRVEQYAEQGLNIKEDQYNQISISQIDVSIVDAVMEMEVNACKAEIIQNLSDAGISDLDEVQINVLTAIKYQYGNIGNFISVYTQYGNSESLRENFIVNGYKVFITGFKGSDWEIKRANGNWKSFNESKYYDSEGNVHEIASQDSFAAAQDGDGYAQTFVANGKEYKEYKQSWGSYQNDTYSDGVIANSGCGPTSVAIVASGYGINHNPGTLVSAAKAKYNVNNFKACPDSTEKMIITAGLNYSKTFALSEQEFRQHLNNGKPAVLSVDSNCGGIFTSSTHYIAILAIDGDYVYVSNPNSKKKTGWVEIDKVLQCNKSTERIAFLITN